MKNPHNWMSALTPAGVTPRVWKCNYCEMKGTLTELDAVACTYVYPPCESCGQTPECAPDCGGIAAVLGRDDVYVAGLGEPIDAD